MSARPAADFDLPNLPRAVCTQVDPELWHPGPGQDPNPAKTICRTCPELNACLIYALSHPDTTGVWGATTEMDRKEIRRAARRTAA